MMQLEEYDDFQLEVNQGFRPAHVLAIIGDEVLVEYEMPRGSTALRIIQNGDDAMDEDGYSSGQTYKNVSYDRLPLRWLEALVSSGTGWIGWPQQTSKVAKEPAFYLERRKRKHGNP
jgi:hypothetical protein